MDFSLPDCAGWPAEPQPGQPGAMQANIGSGGIT